MGARSRVIPAQRDFRRIVEGHMTRLFRHHRASNAIQPSHILRGGVRKQASQQDKLLRYGRQPHLGGTLLLFKRMDFGSSLFQMGE